MANRTVGGGELRGVRAKMLAFVFCAANDHQRRVTATMLDALETAIKAHYCPSSLSTSEACAGLSKPKHNGDV